MKLRKHYYEFCFFNFCVGVTPATSFLNGSQIPLAKNGFIAVDGRMQTKIPHVYAIGDIALFPLSIRGKIRTLLLDSVN